MGRDTGIEWPTVAVAAAIAAGLAAVATFHRRLPAEAEMAALAVLTAWYSSLQHEIIHDHPTRWRRVNRALASVPLSLVVPFPTYRLTHLAHHRCHDRLTDPEVDPESFYVTAARWERTGPTGRVLLWALQTVAGRLALGPALGTVQLWRRHRAVHGPGAVPVALRHGAGVAAVLAVVAATGVSVPLYVVSVVWLGGALSLLRSYAEHRAVAVGSRSAVVRAGWFFSLLYLNNNLHHTHHALPRAPWYALPELSVDLGSDQAARAGAGWYRGYGAIVGRHLWRPLASPVHGATALDPAAGA